MNTVSVMIVGVGGQGSLLASRLIGFAAASAGYDVKVSEVHGMSQRGGCVVTYVKYGEAVYSPIIEKGEADFILALEQLEAARWLPMLKKGGKLIVSETKVMPAGVLAGDESYPKDIIDKLKAASADVIAVDSAGMAMSVGLPKAENVALTGTFAARSGIEKQHWLAALSENVKPAFLDRNREAFELGYAEKDA